MAGIKNIAVTGYFGTGSSAVLDLLKEYSVVSRVPIDRKVYEHVLFYISGGLFDLCSIITRGNVHLRADSAIHNFIDSMNRLNQYEFTWFGSYHNQFGNGFLDIVNDFVKSISEQQDGINVNHCIKSRISVYSTMRSAFAKYFMRKDRHLPIYANLYDKKPVFLSLPSEEEFYSAARKFTSSYLNLFPIKERTSIRVFDHLIWPQQIDAFEKCFDENIYFIVVERDPRDLFLLCKYLYTKNGVKPYFPTDPHKFVDFWKRLIVPCYANKNVIRIHFEDLIYNYEDTVKQIEKKLGLSPQDHNDLFKHLNPKQSIENTQVFLAKPDWEKEVEYIKESLSDYLYAFPFERKPDFALMFDK